MRVLVTGAGGFIGRHLTASLASEPGRDVVPTTRDRRDGTRRLDVLCPADFAPALAGCDAVVHCAVGGEAVTVRGTRLLLEAARRAGVARLVHLSTISVYDAPAGEVGEDAPVVGPATAGYPGWKSAAERDCIEASGIDIVRLRPTIVYGAGSRWWLGQFARRIQSGHWGTFGTGAEGICNLVHVSDVVEAVRTALDHPAAPGEAFNVNGPEPIRWNAWFERLAAAIGAPPLRPHAPSALRRRALAALPLRLVGKAAPRLAEPWLVAMPGRSEVGLFAQTAIFSTDKAGRRLGWTPRTGVDAGLAASLAWLRAEGLASPQPSSAIDKASLRPRDALAAR